VVYPSTQYDVSASGTAAQLYISKLDVKAGGTVRNGALIAEIDGAPMFVLTGSVPAWRDLAPGETGPDVAELQKALAALGYSDEGDTPGYYGGGTEDAVSAFYEHLGYTVPTAAPAGGTGTGAGAATGPQVPQGDVLFLPSLPATVIAVNGAAGQQAGSPFLELSAGGALTLTGELPPSYASQIKTGLTVTLYDEATGIRAAGTVAVLGTATQTLPAGTTVDIGGSGSAAGSPGSSGSSGTSGGSGSSGSSGSSGTSGGSGGTGSGSGSSLFVPVTVAPSSPLPAALNGENVLVTVETGQTEGPVLTVPVAAIVTTASGQSSVTVVAAGGKQTKVLVTPGLSENGYVQVTPVRAGSLAAGDSVVVSG
jgi:HlyD family secretion protein